jgi:alpha-galactosidase
MLGGLTSNDVIGPEAMRNGASVRRYLVLLTLLSLQALPASAETIAATGDASIARDLNAGTWSLTAAGATLQLRLTTSADFTVRLTSPSGQEWTQGAPDTSLTVNGKALVFGSVSSGFAFVTAGVVADGARLHLSAAFDLEADGLRVTRHYVVTDGSPTFESWTSIEQTAEKRVTVANLGRVELTVPAGKIHWLTGLQGDAADVEHDTAFTLHSRLLEPGEQLRHGARGRSSERIVPWFAVDGSPDEFYTALLWSGAWSFTANRTDDRLVLSFGLEGMSAAVTAQPLDGPHVVFGAVHGNVWHASDALRTYVEQGLRQGRPLTSLITYNTWYAYGTRIDENAMRDAMVRAAALGAELFVIDAGWYTGAGTNGDFDFDTGLGTWEADAGRFPNGLAPLSEYAHSLGMKFGIWVEPERVNLDTVDQPGLAQQDWLATNQQQYGSDHAAQVCLAGAAGRQWVLNQLTHLIDTVQPDYLKWDNNLWVNCDRAGHGHGPHEGNFSHVNGLYSVLEALRTQYPDLLIENVSGGGNRLDLGMLRYTDAAWMDDRTAPSEHVRHNIQGLSALFPPAYLLSFVINSAGEPLTDPPDLSLYFRSRMMGGLGLSFRTEGLSNDNLDAMRQQIAMDTMIRDVQRRATGRILSPQARAIGGPGWDVFQETAAGAQQVLIFAVQSDPGVTSVTVKPIGLPSDTRYEVRSADVGVLGVATGEELAISGIDLLQSPISAAHLLILTAQP